MENFNKDYPNYLPDFLSLGREIIVEELRLADKDFLIQLVIELKKKELKYYKLAHAKPYENCNCF